MEPRNVKTRLNLKKRKREKKNLNKKQMLTVLEEQVFSDYSYQRHIDQTAYDLGIPKLVVATVVKHYLESVSIDILRVTKKMRRYIFIGWAHIEILEEKYFEFNGIKSERYYTEDEINKNKNNKK